ncbi:oxidoreductase domain protein [Stanieria cyanosphaera PCC 7437]|uniref:Oxidoreductase domain protein n=1 Tax=Stanieria cyanosphaera (strain ATCC 29371 / PCC 7437) TaxID=111780 RepID=K9XWC7_STAC7|nr:Gfo/Idh/MocA family oxidoreductase [Stanieria cyanosphaera]AFZ36374.1 oxidoreductase domain protein [Stanieria cyanosphaera PCC 7437]
MPFQVAPPVKVGIVGTGYAAKKRAEALAVDSRAKLISVTGNTPEKLQDFSQNFSVTSINSWEQLINQPELDLIFICTINRDHGAIAQAALEADKHVVVEYPLALNPQQAAAIIALAKAKSKLLHVEHIELIGGVHQAICQNLSEVGNVVYARYATISPQKHFSRRWSYHREMFGFPLSAALSRVHRLTDLFGTVATVACQTRYWNASEDNYFTACLCNAQLRFTNGVIAEITYAKGNVFWHGYRNFEIHGDQGTLIFEGETGKLIRGNEIIPLEVTSRRGLFAKDTKMVLDCLLEGRPLYLQPEASLEALKVADVARQSAETNQIQIMTNQLNF